MLVLVISALIFTLVSTILILTCEAFIKLKCFIFFLNKMFNLKSNFLNAYFLKFKCKKKKEKKRIVFSFPIKFALKRPPLNVLETDNLFFFPLFSYDSIVCE